eukprot:m.89656 g.89656  ORF g.89656 m.89656 type:complete len:273 (+) comp21534_c1_seq1:144-962(+)
MIAAVLDRVLPSHIPVDLLNVAFANARAQRPKGSSPYDVPDRITGRAGFEELCALSSRPWRFVEVDVPRSELDQHRTHVRELIRPLTSILDDSIGCALWFAARGVGTAFLSPATSQSSSDQAMPNDKEENYESPAKILLVGMGADEQLGGYSRHRGAFDSASWPGVVKEVQMDLHRISSRNLGRDDRVISDHGKEARFPFLDHQLVSFLNTVPIHIKADLRLPRGEGEKRLLRVCARMIGLKNSAGLPKRAIQFGSRIAKMDSSKQKGSDKF